MKKRTKNRIIICLVACFLAFTFVLLAGFTIKTVIRLNPFGNNHNGFICNDSASDTTPNETLTKFANDNDLDISEWNESLIKLMNLNPEAEEFVLNYPLLKDTEQKIDLSGYDYTTSVPHFIQWDKSWGYTPYGSGVIGTSGCGPTSLSMVAVHLLQDTTYDANYVAKFSEEYGYCVPGNGTAWSLMSEGAQQLGLCSEEIPLDEDIIKEKLESGSPIICIMDKGHFTTDGHYIVMTDYVDGKIKVNDPNSYSRSEQLWNYDDIQGEILNMWAYSV